MNFFLIEKKTVQLLPQTTTDSQLNDNKRAQILHLFFTVGYWEI